MTASPGGLTILRTTDNRFATKRFVWNATLLEWRKISFNAGALFHPAEVAASTLRELVAVPNTCNGIRTR
ncbi:MAG TPA: hypothetical protein VKI44_34150 [Acetobacteraceae bacterium]|nr:hypothetical protein [Acetobacteraceae bacterium]